MIVVHEGQKVSHSSSFQWVSSPGTLVADSLLRDLSAGRLFPQVVGSDSPVNAPLELTGRVFTFAWERDDSGYRARFNIELSLIDTTGKQNVIMRKNYSLSSEPYGVNSAANFAKAMNSLMAQFSRELQIDLCRQAESPDRRPVRSG